MNGLAETLERVGRGQPLSPDGCVSLLPSPGAPAVAAVLGFTAHHLIAADIDSDWLTSRLGNAEIGRPLQPDFLAALGEHLQARPGGQDVLLATVGTGSSTGPELPGLTRDTGSSDHPRVQRASRYRDDVLVAAVHGGLLTIGRGLAGRWEISIEVEPEYRGAGIGRQLAMHGRALVPAEALLWAQVHPANVASVRAFLAAGYRPVGAEVLFTATAPVAQGR